MSTTPSTSETSVTFSLAELAQIERERVQEEEARRAQAAAREAREKRDAAARSRADEEARMKAEADAREKRLREDSIERARAEAREKAAAEVARIEAEGRARLEEGNAARAHELAVIKARSEGRDRGMVRVLAGALALAVSASGFGAFAASRKTAALEQDVSALRDEGLALGREREAAKGAALEGLDRRFAMLKARPIAGSEAARASAEAARGAVDPRSPDRGRVRAFSDALDALEARLATADKLATLDRRQADLGAWAAERKHPEILAAARTAGARARASGEGDAVRGYEAALDQAREALSHETPPAAGGRVPLAGKAEPTVKGVCPQGDPTCGLNGERVF